MPPLAFSTSEGRQSPPNRTLSWEGGFAKGGDGGVLKYSTETEQAKQSKVINSRFPQARRAEIHIARCCVHYYFIHIGTKTARKTYILKTPTAKITSTILIFIKIFKISRGKPRYLGSSLRKGA